MPTYKRKKGRPYYNCSGESAPSWIDTGDGDVEKASYKVLPPLFVSNEFYLALKIYTVRRDMPINLVCIQALIEYLDRVKPGWKEEVQEKKLAGSDPAV